MVPISRVIMYLHFPGLWKKKRTKEALRREMDFHFTIDTFANKSRNKADPQVEFHNTFLADTSSVRLGNFQTTISPTLRFVERSKSSRCFRHWTIRQFVQNGLCQTKRRAFRPSLSKKNESNDRRQMCWLLLLRLTNIKYQADTFDVLPVRKKERWGKENDHTWGLYIYKRSPLDEWKKTRKASIGQMTDTTNDHCHSTRADKCVSKKAVVVVSPEYLFWSYNKSIFTTVHFDENPFKC